MADAIAAVPKQAGTVAFGIAASEAAAESAASLVIAGAKATSEAVARALAVIGRPGDPTRLARLQRYAQAADALPPGDAS